jgi:glycosyltransferase involved in cell wall biosynthesis
VPYRILFMSHQKHLPDVAGGAENSMHDLCSELRTRGAEVGVLARSAAQARDQVAEVLGAAQGSRPDLNGLDFHMGYATYRTQTPLNDIGRVCAEFRADVVVAQPPRQLSLAYTALECNVPCIAYLRDWDVKDWRGRPAVGDGIHYVANSSFIADNAALEFKIERPPVIHSLVQPRRFETSRVGEFVTFVNPVPEKGVEIAFQLAERNPHIPFLFIENWDRGPRYHDERKERAVRCGNISWRPHTNRMIDVFAQTRLLLVPSLWYEGWARTVSEAHISGIPVLGSTRGGLPESIGTGGVALDPDADIEEWDRTLRAIWDDEIYYNALSREAKRYSRRKVMNPHYIADEFLRFVELAVNQATI